MMKYLSILNDQRVGERRVMEKTKTIHSSTILSNMTIAELEDLYTNVGYAAICNDGILQGFIQERVGEYPSTLKLIWLYSR